MADEGLRTLERRWRESGAVDDRAAFLRARVHAGELAQENLLLAAFAGDVAARLLVPNCLCWSGREETRNYHVWGNCALKLDANFRHWMARLQRWGIPVMVQAAVAAGWQARAQHAADCDIPGPRCPQPPGANGCFIDMATGDALRYATIWLANPPAGYSEFWGVINHGFEALGNWYYWGIQTHRLMDMHRLPQPDLTKASDYLWLAVERLMGSMLTNETAKAAICEALQEHALG